MKNLMKSLVVVGLISAAGIAQANIFGDTLNTAGNAVKGGLNTATGAVEDVAHGDVLEMPGNTVKRSVNTATGAVADTGKTVTNVFDGNENQVENNEYRHSDEGPLFSTDSDDYE